MNLLNVNMLRLLLIVCIFICYVTSAQTPLTPQINSFEPVNLKNPTGQKNQYFFNSWIEAEQNKLPSLNNGYLNENNTQTIEQQTNSNAMKAMGYTPPVVPPSDPALFHQFIVNQYNQKLAENSNSNISKQRDLVSIMNEIHEADNRYIAPTDHTQELEEYQKAFSTINDMLIGKTKLSFMNAVYATETAFGNPYLNYAEYKAIISKSADFIKQWLRQQNAPLTSDNLHYAIQQFMGTKTNIKVLIDDKKTTKTIIHNPFKYDYEDYEGEKDYRNFFATKCLATGTGQCSSMPDVYLLLCEFLGVKGYKTFAPMHSFIKYKNTKGSILSYEPTSHWNLPDKWYQEFMGITNTAKKNGIYLDTLNKKQCIANAMVDLAISYMKNSNNIDTAFVQKCLATSNKYFPKNNNLYTYLTNSGLLIRQLHKALVKHGVRDLSQANNYPDTSNFLKRLQQNEEYLKSLGYEDMQKDLYEQLLEQQTNKINTPDAKIKKSLFTTN